MADIALRLRLAGRREAVDGLRDTADAARDVGQEAERAGRRALNGARGLAALGDRKLTAGVRGLAGTLRTGLVGGAKAAGVALAGLGVGMGALAVKSVQLATDAGETASAFGTVFGDQAGAAQAALDGMVSRFGLYGPEVQDAARQFGVFGKAAGVAQGDLAAFSTDLVQAGVDLGSMYNVDAAEAFQAISSGLSGEAEPLRRFGIFLSEANLEAQAAVMGLTGELTEQQKVAVRQAYIMSHLGDAQGDAARTAGGLANQQRQVQNRVKGLATTLGTALVPAVTAAAVALNAGLARAVEWLEPRLPALEAAASRFGDRLVSVAGQVPNLVAALGDLRAGNGADGVAEVLDNMLGNTGQYAEPIRTTVDSLVVKFHEVRGVLSAVGSAVPTVLSPLSLLWGALVWGSQHTTTLKIALGAILPLWGAYRLAVIGARVATVAHGVALGVMAVAQRGNAAATIASTGATAANRVGMLAARAAMLVTRGAVLAWTAAQWLLNAALRANPVGLVVTGVALLVGGLVLAYRRSETFRNIVHALWAKVRDLAGGVRDLATGALASGSRAFQSIRDKVAGFVDKIRDAVRWVKDLAGRVKDLPGAGLVSGALSWLPGREHGGPVAAGQPYVVGERRAELFVPAVDGVILPRVPAVTAVAGSDGPALDPAALDDARPLVVQLVVDRQVLAESAVGGLRAREARR